MACFGGGRAETETDAALEPCLMEVPRPEGGRAQRVLSLNVWAGNYGADTARLDVQLQRVQQLAPDILCLQECFDATVQDMYRQAFPGYSAFVGGRLRSYDWLENLGRWIWLPGALRALLMGDTLGLMCLCNPARVGHAELVLCDFLHASASPDTLVGSVERRFIPRGVMIVKCSMQVQLDGESGVEKKAEHEQNADEDSTTPMPLYVVNVHLNTGHVEPNSGKRGGCNIKRKDQLQEAIARARGGWKAPVEEGENGNAGAGAEVTDAAKEGSGNDAEGETKDGDPPEEEDDGRNRCILLCGDTNADADTQPEMIWLRQEAGFVDSHLVALNRRFPGADPVVCATWNNSNPYSQGWMVEEDQRIDIAYLSPSMLECGWAIQDARVVFNSPPFPSDHYALCADLIPPQRSEEL